MIPGFLLRFPIKSPEKLLKGYRDFHKSKRGQYYKKASLRKVSIKASTLWKLGVTAFRIAVLKSYFKGIGLSFNTRIYCKFYFTPA